MIIFRIFLLTLFAFWSVAEATPPTSFSNAKRELRVIYNDHPETFYCGCVISWSKRNNGVPDLKSCGYQVRKNASRANSIEWEHVVPAHTFGQQRACWRAGGRKNCAANDPVFRQMEADMFNLVPAIGEVNGDRSNFRFGVLPAASGQHGRCPVKIDFQQRVVEPRSEIRGEIARINFYMYDRYNLRMSKQQEQLFLAWHKQYPVSAWERRRDARIAKVTGYSNPFVSGERSWTSGYIPSADNYKIPNRPEAAEARGKDIKGNTNSQVYHLPSGCPSYEAVKPENARYFLTEAEAVTNGYRKAGNCS